MRVRHRNIQGMPVCLYTADEATIYNIVMRSDIIGQLARDKVVEKIIENVTHRAINRDTQDLAQMVYLTLLTYDEKKVMEMWKEGELNFFIVAIIRNQYFSETSPFYQQIKRLRVNSEELNYDD